MGLEMNKTAGRHFRAQLDLTVAGLAAFWYVQGSTDMGIVLFLGVSRRRSLSLSVAAKLGSRPGLMLSDCLMLPYVLIQAALGPRLAHETWLPCTCEPRVPISHGS